MSNTIRRTTQVLILSLIVSFALVFPVIGGVADTNDEVLIVYSNFNVITSVFQGRHEDILDGFLSNDYFEKWIDYSIPDLSIVGDYSNFWLHAPADSIIDRETGLVSYFGRSLDLSLDISDAEILLSDASMRNFLEENGVTNIKNVKIFFAESFVNGFIARVETEYEIYFAVFLFGSDEQKGFRNRGVYTAEVLLSNIQRLRQNTN